VTTVRGFHAEGPSSEKCAHRADTKQPGGVMSEEALAEKEAAVAGEGLSPMASRAHMSTHSGFSGQSGPTSARSLAGAAHRVSMGSASPPTSKRDLDVDGHPEVLPLLINLLFHRHLLQPGCPVSAFVAGMLCVCSDMRGLRGLASCLAACWCSHPGPVLAQQMGKGHQTAVDVVGLNSNGKLDASNGEATQSALPFDQLYMTFNHGAQAAPQRLFPSPSPASYPPRGLL